MIGQSPEPTGVQRVVHSVFKKGLQLAMSISAPHMYICCVFMHCVKISLTSQMVSFPPPSEARHFGLIFQARLTSFCLSPCLFPCLQFAHNYRMQIRRETERRDRLATYLHFSMCIQDNCILLAFNDYFRHCNLRKVRLLCSNHELTNFWESSSLNLEP